MTTAEALRLEGFSDTLVDAFFRPFLGGIFLDASLDTSSRLFAFVFKLFSEGEAALPAAGMQAIPRQLAEGLPEAALRLGVTVESAAPGRSGHRRRRAPGAPAIVVAADGPEAARLTGAVEAPAARGVPRSTTPPSARRSASRSWCSTERAAARSTTCACRATWRRATRRRGRRWSRPPCSASHRSRTRNIDDAVRAQLRDWFGAQVDGWRPLRAHRIPFALPAQPPAALVPAERPVRLRDGLYVCGDHRDTASIQGAMASGRRAAAAVRGLDAAPACSV